MSNLRISKIVERVNQLAEVDDSLDISWIGASDNAAIQTLETALGVNISGSFRDFILQTGGGGLADLYISSISKDEPLSGCYDDTIYYKEDWCPHKLPDHLIVIQRDFDDNEPMCLDSSVVINGENPVVLYYYQSTGEIEKIADSFSDYYHEFLTPYFDNNDI
ncbi:SMI1/KNR4 family protein [Sphingobacterium yanglingense]|uniref:SUKH superfamily protein n=1 Tax=Sphingobacterium yanglingense TaxID=1437280 RepID=A0A4R6W5A2_9SPHI|nr:SMI1/KNR4 family protein [Sphingobacterium yanglingense]TDQ73897.1 SUKH superfamily protein [Sphingobacterium yanglingense]